MAHDRTANGRSWEVMGMNPTLAEGRLNGIALMDVHTEVHIIPDRVNEIFASSKKCRLPFALQ